MWYNLKDGKFTSCGIFRMLLLSMLKLILVLLGSHDLWPKHNHYFGKNCLTWILPLLFLLCTCRTDLTDATNRVGALQRQLRDLQGSRQNRLTLFGSWQPDLHQRIEQAVRRGRFHHAPVGPIGMELLSCSARVLHSVERNNLLLVNTYLCQKPLTQKRCLHFGSIITLLCMLAYSFKAWPAQIFTSYTVPAGVSKLCIFVDFDYWFLFSTISYGAFFPCNFFWVRDLSSRGYANSNKWQIHSGGNDS